MLFKEIIAALCEKFQKIFQYVKMAKLTVNTVTYSSVFWSSYYSQFTVKLFEQIFKLCYFGIAFEFTGVTFNFSVQYTQHSV
jgi:hypothetical protein